MTKNFSFLFRYLKKEKINIDQNEFIFQAQSHNNYPSLLSISDTLNFFKIPNLVTRLENKDIEHLPNAFIALLGEDTNNAILEFVERKNNDFQYFKNNKKITIPNTMFEKIFKNVVLLVENNEDETVIKKTKKTIAFGVILLISIYLFSIFTNPFSLSLPFFICLAMIGFYLSVEAIYHEFGIQTKFSEAVCTITSNSNCDAVINAKKIKFLEKFSFSQASITFFSAQLAMLLLFSISNTLHYFYNITVMLLLFSIPITFYSFYQQIVIAKKICPICLGIIAVLYTEMVSILVYVNFDFTINKIAINYFLLTFILAYLVSMFFKNIMKQNISFKSKIAENNRFKRRYSLFKMALLVSDVVSHKKNILNNILLGNPKAPLKIIVVSNPFCGHCKNMHKTIEEILVMNQDKVCFDLHFNFDDSKSDEKSKKIHQNLIQIYFNEGSNVFMKKLHDWFESKEENELLSNSASTTTNLKVNEILNQQFSWNNENKINYTPAIIINNYLFPKEYDSNDLIYFINELLEDQDFN